MGTIPYTPPKGDNNGERCIKTLSNILKEEKKMKAIEKMLESERRPNHLLRGNLEWQNGWKYKL